MLNDSHTMSLPVYKALLSLSLSLWCLKASSLISLPPSPSLPQMKKKLKFNYCDFGWYLKVSIIGFQQKRNEHYLL